MAITHLMACLKLAIPYFISRALSPSLDLSVYITSCSRNRVFACVAQNSILVIDLQKQQQETVADGGGWWMLLLQYCSACPSLLSLLVCVCSHDLINWVLLRVQGLCFQPNNHDVSILNTMPTDLPTSDCNSLTQTHGMAEWLLA